MSPPHIQEIIAHNAAIPVLVLEPKNQWFATGSADKLVKVSMLKNIFNWQYYNPAGIYLFKANNGSTKTDFTHCSGVSIVDFEQVNAGSEDCLAYLNSYPEVFREAAEEMRILSL